MPDTVLFPSSVPRVLNEKLGENISTLDFGALADGQTDAAAAFAAAIQDANEIGGCLIRLPRGQFLLDSPIELGADVENITFEGDGASTVILRGADLPAGQGLFDIAGKRITLRKLVIDGQVTTPVGKQYGTFIGENSSDDPMHADLTLNTSVWVQSGAESIRLDQVEIRHTGGYAVLLDARTADVRDVAITDSVFEHNRPHLFGTDDEDLNYGSWTGGIHYQGDGRASENKLFSMKNLLVRGCKFRRCTGNQVWGHLYGFDAIHQNIRIEANHFEDIGRDGVLLGGVIGGAVTGNTFRRIGYIAVGDTGAAEPRFLAGHYAVGLDTAGLARGVNYTGNTFVSCCGGNMDLDGYADGSVHGNTCIVPRSGEPEYTEDQISSWSAGNWTYGVQVSNSNNLPGAAVGVIVTGNRFANMGGGAVRFYATRRSYITGNIIEHEATANMAPIRLGNIGTGANQRSYSNVVSENTIHYDPTSPVGAIQEDANGSAFEGTDSNWVFGNRLFGACFEFLKDEDSGSTTRIVLATSAVAAAVSENIIQREGLDETAVLHWYKRIEDTSTVIMSLLDQGPLLNVSEGGDRYTGSISTGGRTTLAFGDTVATGKLYGDAFLALTDGEYLGADADALDSDTWGLIRYNSTLKKFEQSIEVSGGHRVWSDLGGEGGQSLPSWFVLVDSPAEMRLVGPAATAEATLQASPDATLRGHYWNGSASTAVDALLRHEILSAAGQPNSQLEFWIAGTKIAALRSISDPPYSAAARDFRLYGGTDIPPIFSLIAANGSDYADFTYNGTDADIDVSAGGLNLRPLASGGAVRVWNEVSSVKLRIGDAGFAKSIDLYHDGTNGRIDVSNGYLALGSANLLVDSAGNLSAVGVLEADGGFNTDNSAYNAIQAPLGGLTGKYLTASVYLALIGTTEGTAGLSGSGAAKIIFDVFANKIRVSENGGAYVNLVPGAGVDTLNTLTGSITIQGTANQVTITPSGQTLTLALPQNIHNAASPSFGSLTLTAANAALQLTSGYVDSASGFYSASSSDEAVKVLSGGVWANKIISKTSAYLIDTSASPPPSPGSGYGGVAYHSGSVYRFWTGSSWLSVDMMAVAAPGIAAVNSQTGPSLTIAGTAPISVSAGSNVITVEFTGAYGVSQVNAGANLSVNQNTGAVIVSLVTSPSVVGLTITGAEAALQLTSGYVDSASGFYSASSSDEAVKVLSGGVWANKIISKTSAYLIDTSASPPPSPGSGYGGVAYHSGSVYRFWTGSSWLSLDMVAVAAPGITAVNSQGGPAIVIAGTAPISVSAAANTITIGFTGAYGVSQVNAGTNISVNQNTGAVIVSLVSSPSVAGLTITGSGAALQLTNGYVNSASGFYSPSSSDEAVKVLSGGVWANKIISKTSAYLIDTSASPPPSPGSGYGGVAYHSGSVYRFWTGSAWLSVDMVAVAAPGITAVNSQTGPAITIAGTAPISVSAASNTVTVGFTGAYGVSQVNAGTNIAVSPTTGAVTVALVGTPSVTGLTITGGGAALQLTNGYVDSAVGFYTAGTADNAVNLPNGGVWANKIISKTACYLDDTSTSAPAPPGGGYGGLAYHSGSIYRFWTGSSWLDRDIASLGVAPANMVTTDTVQTISGVKTFSSDLGVYTNPDTGNSVKLAFQYARYIALESWNMIFSCYSSGTFVFRDEAKQRMTIDNNGVVTMLSALPQYHYQGLLCLRNTNEARSVVPIVFFNANGGYVAGVVGKIEDGRAYPYNRGGIDFMVQAGAASNVVGSIYSTGAVRFSGAAGAAGLTLEAGWVDCLGGYYSAGTADNLVNIPQGGVWANKIISKTACYLDDTSTSAPAPPGGGYGGLAYHSGSVYRFWTGSAWFDLDVSSRISSINGMTGPAITFSGTSPISISAGSNIVTIGLASSFTLASLLISGAGAGLQLTSGYVDAAGGFYSSSAADNAVNLPNGGVWANKLISKTACYLDDTSTSEPAPPGGGYGGLAYNSGSVYRYWNGTAWCDYDFAAAGGGTGVSSVWAGSGIQVSPNTGAVTVSLHPWPVLQALTLSSSGAALTLMNGWADVAGGFYSAVVSQEAVKLPYGGLACREVNIYPASGGGAYYTVINGSREGDFSALKIGGLYAIDLLGNLSLIPKSGLQLWQSGHVVFGGWHLWPDGYGKLRIKFGQPASDVDGTVVGTQS